MLSVKFDDIEMSDYITVLHGFTTFDGADFQPELKEIDGGNGSKFLYTRHGYKTITMPFFVKKNLNDKYDVLEKILSVKEPKPLIFGNMPDRCFYAVPSSTLSFDEILDFGKGTITWLVPDGLAHATIETPFTAALNSDGVLEATIVNDGTAEVPISYEIKHKSDNGYVGIVSEYGAMEFGNRDEIDKINPKKSEKVIAFDYKTQPAEIVLGEGVSCYPNYLSNPDTPNVINGSFTFGVNSYGTSIAKPVFDNSTAKYWHGPMFHADIPLSSENTNSGPFIFRNRFDFTTGVKQAGRTELTLESAGAVAISCVIRDSAYGSDEMVWEIIVKNTMQKSIVLDRRKFINGVYFLEVSRLGSQLNFKLARANSIKGDEVVSNIVKTVSLNLAYMSELPITGLTVWLQAFEKAAVTSMGITDTSFYWADLDNWVDLANRYSAGDVFYVDGISKQPYLNGVGALNDEIIGTNYFLAPPGETKVKFYFSDFGNELPDVKAIIRKGWL